MDSKRRDAGQKLLDAAHEFWDACREEGQYGAVQWLEATDGAIVIFTRGEYRHTLLNNITMLGCQKEHRFHGEKMPECDDE